MASGEFDLDQAVLHGLWDARGRLADDFGRARDGEKAHAVGGQVFTRPFAKQIRGFTGPSRPSRN